MPFVPALPWRWIAIAVVTILCGVLYLEVKRIAHLEAQLDATVEIANTNAEIAQQERAFRRRADAIASANAAVAERARKLYRSRRQEVADAERQDDAPMAPILRHVLDQLPEPEAPPAAHGNPPRSPGTSIQCQDGPARPGPDATQRDAAIVIVDFQEALEDCKGKLTTLLQILTFPAETK